MHNIKTFLPWIISAILMGLSFPSFENIPTGVLAWFAFVPILLASKELPSFGTFVLRATVFAIIFLSIELWWVIYYFSWPAVLVALLQVPGLLLLWIAYFFIHKKLKWNIALLLFPFLLVLGDFFIHHLPHGYQVYLYSYSQSNMIWFIQFVDIFGMWGIAFWLGLLNVTIALAAINKNIRHYAIVGLTIFIPLVYGIGCLNIIPEVKTGMSDRTTSVGIIQTNQKSHLVSTEVSFDSIFSEIYALSSRAVINTKPDLLVLPETAVPLPILQDEEMRNLTRSLVSQLQTSVAIGFVNYPDEDNPHFFENNAMVFTPQLAMFWDSLDIQPEEVKVYQKEFGLPFVEVMPYFEDAPTFRNQAMRRGHESHTFNYNNFNGDKFTTGLAICWEQMYPHKLAALVKNGAEFLCFMNNDSWFGKTPGSIQLKSFSRIRAIENRRSVVRTSNGGISCFIDPFGRISGALPWYVSDTNTEEILCVDRISFYSRYPNWLPIFCGIFIVGALFLSYIMRETK